MLLRLAHHLAGLAAMLAMSTPLAAAGSPCGPFNPAPVLKPVLMPATIGQSDAAVDCFMWQTFIYLNWPAAGGQRGQPNPNAAFGSPGPTVWETFKTVDEVFLANGQNPGPWSTSATRNKLFKARGVSPGTAGLRLLNNKSKFFRAMSSAESTPLNEVTQAGGGILYDQASQPVYYEMLMNQAGYNYIIANQMYNANTQYQVAAKSGLDLPAGSMEVKAAWKVLTPQELAATPSHFHTAQAMLPGGSSPVTVGLVGLHIFQMPSTSFPQGFWATFVQSDSAPLASGGTPQASYSFNNPACAPAQCPPNVQPATPAPVQVVQVFGSTPEATAVNSYVQTQLAPGPPWQYYQLISVQWPTSPQTVGTPGQQTPLPNGSPNTTTLMNPVLETYLQKPTTSCLGCHTYASTATPNNLSNPLSLGSSYSFLFGHATAPASTRKLAKTSAKK